MEWFYAKEDEKIGPITKENIKVLVENDVIKQDTMIWCSEWENWKSYKDAFSEIEHYQAPVAPIAPIESEVEVRSDMCNDFYNPILNSLCKKINGCKTMLI